MKDCTWFPWCADPASHPVERRTPGGSTLREVVCERHLRNACEHGFDPAPAPAPAPPTPSASTSPDDAG